MDNLSTAISCIVRTYASRSQYDISDAVNEMLLCVNSLASFRLSATGDAVSLVTTQGDTAIIGPGCNHFVRASCARIARLLFLGRGHSDPYLDEGDIEIATNDSLRYFHVEFNNRPGIQFLQVYRIV